MPQTLNYATPEQRPRPTVALLIVAAIWWTAVLLWLIQQINVVRSWPVYAEELRHAALVAALAVASSVVLAMSLLARRVWATKAAIGMLGCATFLALLIGITVGLKTLFSPERPAVAAVIFAETFAVASIAALSAWLFRGWLRDRGLRRGS